MAGDRVDLGSAVHISCNPIKDDAEIRQNHAAWQFAIINRVPEPTYQMHFVDMLSHVTPLVDFV